MTGLKKIVGIIVLLLLNTGASAMLDDVVVADVLPYSNQVERFFSGVINPIFAFCSLLLLVVVLQLWREKLKAEVVVTENQRFENTLFALLEQHNAFLNKANNDNLATFIGALLLHSKTCEEAKKQLAKNKVIPPQDSNMPENFIEYAVLDIPINQYFLVLYQLLILIASSCQSSPVRNKKFTIKNLQKTRCSDEEKFYADIVRACLTDEICYLLLINCYCKYKQDNFYKYKLLIERYSLLEQIGYMPNELPSFVTNKQLLTELEDKFERIAFRGEHSGNDEFN